MKFCREKRFWVHLVCRHKMFYNQVKCEIRPRTGHEDPEGEYSYRSTLTLTSALDGVGYLKQRSGRFIPGNI
jgi:hypothetical protein